MHDIARTYGYLSPENLTCDGELSRSASQSKARQLNRELKGFFQELGRTVTETEAYEII